MISFDSVTLSMTIRSPDIYGKQKFGEWLSYASVILAIEKK